jgi:hypothetical protein
LNNVRPNQEYKVLEQVIMGDVLVNYINEEANDLLMLKPQTP